MQPGIHPPPPVDVALTLPGDEMIAHQAAVVASLSDGSSRLSNVPKGRAFRVTLDALSQLGIAWEEPGPRQLVIHGRGGRLARPAGPVECADSPVTARLLMGVLAAQPFESTLTCTGRPGNPGLVTMANALVRMGAEVLHSETAGGFEVKIKGAELIGQSLVVQEPDGAVKAALLFAGVLAHGVTTVTDRSGTTVDHAERLLRAGGINVTGGPDAVRLVGGQRPRPLEIELPGDLSAAACWLAFAACRRGSRLILRNVCLNRHRLGFLTVLLRMGARIREEVIHCGEGEWHGILDIRGAELRPVVIDFVKTPALMEHAPLLAVVAAMAKGVSAIQGLSAWSERDPDRVRFTFSMLRSMGVRVEEREDRMRIRGTGSLPGGVSESIADPRLAMTCAVAAALANTPSRTPDADTVAAVDPDFWCAFDRVLSRRFGPP